MKISKMLLVICLVLLLPGLVYSQTIKVAVDDYAPFKIIENGNVVGGIDTVLIDTLLGHIGLSARHELFPWARCLNNMKVGESDLISGVTYREDRAEYMQYFSFPYKTKSVKSFYVAAGEGSSFQSLSDLEGLKVGVLRGSKYFDDFDANTRIQKYELNNNQQGFEMLANGRIDALIVTKENGKYDLSGMPASVQNRVEPANYEYTGAVEVFLAMSKKSPMLGYLDEMETALRGMQASGELQRILDMDF